VATLCAAATLAIGCGGKAESDGGAAAQKKALEQAAGIVKEPMGLISAYAPYVAPYEKKDKYAPRNHPVYDRAAAAAANEMRHAANGARQRLPSAAGPVGDAMGKALLAVATSCADAADDAAFAKCNAAVTALNTAMADASKSGTTFPGVGPASITDEAKKAVARLEKVNGPGKAEAAYFAKRNDPSASAGDVGQACQAAATEVDGIANEFEKADEPIRVTAVTHKMNLDAQCHRIDAVADLAKSVIDCKKTPKKPDCLAACGKAHTAVDEGLPAAAFEAFAKDVTEICK
jgi:hypothetical protein